MKTFIALVNIDTTATATATSRSDILAKQCKLCVIVDSFIRSTPLAANRTESRFGET